MKLKDAAFYIATVSPAMLVHFLQRKRLLKIKIFLKEHIDFIVR